MPIRCAVQSRPKENPHMNVEIKVVLVYLVLLGNMGDHGHTRWEFLPVSFSVADSIIARIGIFLVETHMKFVLIDK